VILSMELIPLGQLNVFDLMVMSLMLEFSHGGSRSIRIFVGMLFSGNSFR
jgi:hypothetical protein